MTKLKTAQKVSQSIIVNQIALHYNSEIKHTKFYKHNLKKQLNLLISELEKAEKKEFELMFEKDNLDEIVVNFQNLFCEMVNELSTIDIQYVGEITGIIKAYKKDSKSLLGITKKVLNNKK